MNQRCQHVKVRFNGTFAWIIDRRDATEPRRKYIPEGMPAYQTRGMGGRYPHTPWGRRVKDRDAYDMLINKFRLARRLESENAVP